MWREFSRVAVFGRGTAAVRFVHAAREMALELGKRLETVAVVTEDAQATVLAREADAVVDLGAPTVVDPRTGQRRPCWHDPARLRRALLEARADAVWPGSSAVAEHPAFFATCRDLGLVLLGPTSTRVPVLGDKVAAKRLAEEVGIRVVPWPGTPAANAAELRAQARALGLPVMLKPVGGTEGAALHPVQVEGSLDAAAEALQAEAAQELGEGALLLVERLLAGARCIEVFVAADDLGTVWPLGIRDASLCRARRLLLAESPPPGLRAEQLEQAADAAVRLCRAAGFVGTMAVEFLVDAVTGELHFLELNPRRPDDHAVAELTAGIDLPRLQLILARGYRLEGQAPRPRGHAMSVLLEARDAEASFAPSGRRIEHLALSPGTVARLDAAVEAGDPVPARDPALGTLLAHAEDRRAALARLRRAVLESEVVIDGGTSTRPVIAALLEHPGVIDPGRDVSWFSAWLGAGPRPAVRHVVRALLLAAVEGYEADRAQAQARFRSSAARGRPEVPSGLGGRVLLGYGGERLAADVRRLRPSHYRVTIDGATRHLQVEHRGPFARQLVLDGRRSRALVVPEGVGWRIEIEGSPHRILRADAGAVHAPAPAVVVSVTVRPGDEVQAGDRLVVLEAMKMEMPVLAPFAGRVREVLVTPNLQVGPGTALVMIEPVSLVTGTAPAGGIDLGPAAAPALPDATETLALLRGLVLGYDVDAADVVQAWAAHDASAAVDESRVATENAVLDAFADVWSVLAVAPPATDGLAGDEGSAEERPGEEWLLTYLRTPEVRSRRLPQAFLEGLERALGHYGASTSRPGPALDEALMLLWQSRQRLAGQVAAIMTLLERRLDRAAAVPAYATDAFRRILDRLAAVSTGRHAGLTEVVRQLRFRLFEEPRFERLRAETHARALAALDELAANPPEPRRGALLDALVECPQPLVGLFSARLARTDPHRRALMLEVLVRRYYRIRQIEEVTTVTLGGRGVAQAVYSHDGRRIHVLATHADRTELAATLAELASLFEPIPPDHAIVLDLFLEHPGPLPSADEASQSLAASLSAAGLPPRVQRIAVALAGPEAERGMGGILHLTFRPQAQGYAEDPMWRGLHPMMGKRLELARLVNFDIERLPSAEDVYLFRGVARSNPKDERLFAFVEVRDLTVVRDEAGQLVDMPHLDRMVLEAAAAIRDVQARRPARERLQWNRLYLYCWQPLTLAPEELQSVVERLGPALDGLGLEKVVVRARMPDPDTGALRDQMLHIGNPGGRGFVVTVRPPTSDPLEPLTPYTQKVVQLRQRGLVHPYEIVRMIAPPRDGRRTEFPPGEFVEHDLDASGALVPVQRPWGENAANIVVGTVRNFTAAYPEGMLRVILLGDPSRSMGALAEPECARINAALDLAERLRVPVEWFALSAGAKISMESGTENMDWIARVLRRLIEFTQAGGEVNVVVVGINVGAQPYWNAEATMLMHTKGILVMTPEGAMVLTGKQALDYSGSVSADDNFGIGGYDRIMGPNGQAQYRARSLTDACHILFRHYEHAYVMPGERFPRRVPTRDPIDRDVCASPHGGELPTVGDVFSERSNPGRKRPFDIRRIMHAVCDQDHQPLERWMAMLDAEVAVVWDAHLGGYPVCLLGFESHPLPRQGFLPADGPPTFTAGTLFPMASKKVARAVNAASNNRPLVVLANLSGFDGSPESMRRWQLEYGAEIGRAVVNFRGPIVFAVISRYHGGAFVVFSRVLNDNMEAIALEGTYASVIGGAPAAAVVFAGEVDRRTRQDPRVVALQTELAQATGPARAHVRLRLEETMRAVRSEKLGEVADEFDHVHTVQRALSTGSLDRIIPPAALRPYLVEAIERGISRTLEREGCTDGARHCVG